MNELKSEEKTTNSTTDIHNQRLLPLTSNANGMFAPYSYPMGIPTQSPMLQPSFYPNTAFHNNFNPMSSHNACIYNINNSVKNSKVIVRRKWDKLSAMEKQQLYRYYKLGKLASSSQYYNFDENEESILTELIELESDILQVNNTCTHTITTNSTNSNTTNQNTAQSAVPNETALNRSQPNTVSNTVSISLLESEDDSCSVVETDNSTQTQTTTHDQSNHNVIRTISSTSSSSTCTSSTTENINSIDLIEHKTQNNHNLHLHTAGARRSQRLLLRNKKPNSELTETCEQQSNPKIVTNKRHMCPKNGCNVSYGTRKGLLDHLQKHGVCDEIPFICNNGQCKRVFDTKFALDAHIKRKHRARNGSSLRCFECNFCHKKFYEPQGLANHTRFRKQTGKCARGGPKQTQTQTRTNPKQTQRQIPNNLQTSTRSSTGTNMKQAKKNRQFVCDKCDHAPFATMKWLTNHKIIKHDE